MAHASTRPARGRWPLLALLLLVAWPSAAWPRSVIRVVEENDFFAGRGDFFYTQGLQLSFEQVATAAGGWPVTPSSASRWILAQNMYTPSDITVDTLLTHDRPYGGWLHVAHERRWGGLSRRQVLRLDAGVLGPHAYAAEVQTEFHEWIGAPEPKGWHLQLPDRVAVTVLYRIDQAVATVPLLGHPLRLSLGTGATGGNVFDQLEGSATLTYGSIGDPLGEIEPSPPSSWVGGRKPYGVSAAIVLRSDARYVMYNAFLDPRPPAAPLEISTLPWVMDLEAGVQLRLRTVQLQYVLVKRSSEFRPGDGGHVFASLQLALMF